MIVTVQPNASPPRIKIETTELTVTRTIGGVVTPVRGESVAGVIFDYEAPQEVPVTYSDGINDEIVVMPNVGNWLIHLTKPELSCPIEVEVDDAIESPSTVKTLPLLSRAPHTVATGRNTFSSGLSVHTFDLDEVEALHELLKDESVLWVSTHASHGWGPFYARVLDVSTARFMAWCESPRRVVSLPILLQDRPVQVDAGLTPWEQMPTTWAGMPDTWAGMPA